VFLAAQEFPKRARARARLNLCRSARTGSLDRFNFIVLHDIEAGGTGENQGEKGRLRERGEITVQLRQLRRETIDR